uniref:Glycolipid transfer protein domain-containing protein n=1 Tax=Ciona savignyi TaxID=51511 RepID=H2ZQ12_CIOSA
MSPLRADIQSNILKIRTEMKNSPIKYEYLEEMVAHQISTKQHTGPNTSTQALLWLNRALSVMSTFLRKLVSSDSATKYDTGASFVLAYDEMLAKHHNWMVQRLFKIGLKMVPLYSAFKQNMIDKRCWEAAQQSGDPDWEDQIEKKMIGHAREYCGHMASVASQIRQMYKTHNIDP